MQLPKGRPSRGAFYARDSVPVAFRDCSAPAGFGDCPMNVRVLRKERLRNHLAWDFGSDAHRPFDMDSTCIASSLSGRSHSVNGPSQDNVPSVHDHSDVWPCFRFQIAAVSASMSSQVL
jgi:hypothetical protein